MVSIMNEALKLELGHKVLEIGSGSGWHSVTICEIVSPKNAPKNKRGHVYTVEIIQGLADLAMKNINKAGYERCVTVIYGDGSLGYPQMAPYDRIVVAASAPRIPETLINQLKNGGIMLVPEGNFKSFQNLIKITKKNNGDIKRENLGSVAFVPLTGVFGQKI